MRDAHAVGLPATATMVVGLGETAAERIEHLDLVRSLQDETHNLRAFIPWTFSPKGTRLASRPAAGGAEYLRMLAASRLYLDNIPHLGSGWLTEGMKVAQLGLLCGADDMGGTLIEDHVLAATGKAHGTNADALRTAICGAGLRPARRNSAYEILEVLPC
jgi:cyclic dehypoxanthinyl futalosine synthase